MNTFRRSLYLFLILTVLACGILFGFQTFIAAKQAYALQLQTVQNLAGAFLDGHPELEGRFMDALSGEEFRAAGADVLTKYGLDPDSQMNENEAYRAILRRSGIQLLLFSSLIFLLTLALSLLLRREQERSLRAVLAVTQDYLAGNYAFSDSPEGLPDGTSYQTRSLLEDTLKQLGGRIQLQREQLEEEQEHTKALVTDISHQLKTPISALKLCFSMYLEAEDEAERAEFLSRSQLQIDKLEALTAALMNISRLESAMIELKPEQVSLSALLAHAADAAYPKAQKKEISIEAVPFPDVELTADPRWTAEAVLNVLDNAVKYSPPGSKITITVKELASLARIEITDQGVGIPRGEHAKIFSRFYRGAAPAVQQAEGSGVGLYLTRSILEKQGGSILVKSGPGQGSTFVLQLPKRAFSRS